MGAAMSDLDTLIPQAVELVIDGEPLAIKPLKVGQMPGFLRAISPVMQQLTASEIDWLALFGERGDDLLSAIAIAVGKPRAWVDELDADGRGDMALPGAWRSRVIIPAIMAVTAKYAIDFTLSTTKPLSLRGASSTAARFF